MGPPPGLEWKSCLFGFEPSWTVEPQIEVIQRIASEKLGRPRTCSVEFFAQGAFNKLYTGRCEKREYLMRVSLPVDPRYKTLSEVATLDFVRQNTEMPVPKVVAFDASSDNELGFEWMLMEMIAGQPLAEQWRTMSWTAKEKLVKHMALFAAQLFRKKFYLLGNLYQSQNHSNIPNEAGLPAEGMSPENFVIDRIVSMQFFWADHANQDVPRGPFKSSEEWLSARLLLNKNDSEKTLQTSEDESDLEDARNVADNINKLVSLLPLAFPSDPESPEPTVLMHDDLSGHNILVDHNGDLTAILDWECVSALPLWKVCQFPAFLEGKDRNDMPVRETYAVAENGEVNELFWEHLFEYEQTQLRKTFIQQMHYLEPTCVEILSASQRKADIELAVHNCDNIFCIRLINMWLDDFAQEGEIWSLKKQLME